MQYMKDDEFEALKTSARVHSKGRLDTVRCGGRQPQGDEMNEPCHSRYAMLDHQTLNGVVAIIDFQKPGAEELHGWTDEALIAVLLDRARAVNIGGVKDRPRYHHDTIRGLELALISSEAERASDRVRRIEETEKYHAAVAKAVQTKKDREAALQQQN